MEYTFCFPARTVGGFVFVFWSSDFVHFLFWSSFTPPWVPILSRNNEFINIFTQQMNRDMSGYSWLFWTQPGAMAKAALGLPCGTWPGQRDWSGTPSPEWQGAAWAGARGCWCRFPAGFLCLTGWPLWHRSWRWHDRQLHTRLACQPTADRKMGGKHKVKQTLCFHSSGKNRLFPFISYFALFDSPAGQAFDSPWSCISFKNKIGKEEWTYWVKLSESLSQYLLYLPENLKVHPKQNYTF